MNTGRTDPSASSATSPGPDGVRDDAAARVRVVHLVTLFVWAAAIALLFYFFSSFKLLLLGLLAAASVAAALRPLRRRIPGPRGLGALLAGLIPILIAVGLAVLISTLLAGRLRQEWQNWPTIQQRIDTKLAEWGRRLGADDPPTVQSLLDQARAFLFGGEGAGTQVISTTANVISGLVFALVFVFIGSIYLLVEREDRLLRPVQRMLPPDRAAELRRAIDDLEPRLRWWLIGTLFSMTIVGGLSWASFAVIGLEFALPLALLVAVAEIVPTVGPAVAFLVVLLFAATQGSGAVVGVVIAYLAVQALESYVLLPMIMRQAVHVPPVVTLFTVIVWGQVFGIAGLLLAIPLDLLIWSVVDNFVIRHREPPGGG